MNGPINFGDGLILGQWDVPAENALNGRQAHVKTVEASESDAPDSNLARRLESQLSERPKEHSLSASRKGPIYFNRNVKRKADASFLFCRFDNFYLFSFFFLIFFFWLDLCLFFSHLCLIRPSIGESIVRCQWTPWGFFSLFHLPVI